MIHKFLRYYRQVKSYLNLVDLNSANKLYALANTDTDGIHNIHLERYQLDTPRLKPSIPLYLRGGSTDLDVFHSVFLRRDYELPICHQSRKLLDRYERLRADGVRPLILGCGANTGFSSIWFQLAYPEAHIAAVEPSPENFRLLEMNTATLNFFTGIEGAVDRDSGSACLVDRERGEWGYEVSDETTKPGAVVIRRWSIDELIKWIQSGTSEQIEPWICKIDIEGGESRLFSGDCTWFNSFSMYAIELHDTHFPGARSSHPFLLNVIKHGYEVAIHGETMYAFRPELTQ